MIPALQATTLYRFFRSGDEEVLALQNVSLTVWPGELVAVTGPSGSGKSTLLSCLAGLEEPDGGTAHISGHRMSHRRETVRARLRASELGLLLQDRNLLPHLSVRQNIVLVQRLARHPRPIGVRSLLDSLDIGATAKMLPRDLSGGESVRAGLAVALANDPVAVLADEPTGELDGAAEREVLLALRARADAGTAVLVASHSHAVTEACDRVVALSEGQVIS